MRFSLKNWFTAEATSRGKRSETTQTPNTLQKNPAGSPQSTNPRVVGFCQYVQPDQSLVDGRAQSELMRSQLN